MSLPFTWSNVWRMWVAVSAGYLLTDLVWVVAGGNFLAVPWWLEFGNGVIMAVAYRRWLVEQEREREQAVSEEDRG